MSWFDGNLTYRQLLRFDKLKTKIVKKKSKEVKIDGICDSCGVSFSKGTCCPNCHNTGGVIMEEGK